MIRGSLIRPVTAGGALVGSCLALAACGGSPGPLASATLKVGSSPTHVAVGGTEKLKVAAGPFAGGVGDLIIEFDWQRQHADQFGAPAEYPDGSPYPTITGSRCVPFDVTKGNNSSLSIVGNAIDCGPVAKGGVLDVTVTYPVEHTDSRVGVVRLFDAGQCNSITGCSGSGAAGSNAGVQINALPGSTSSWREAIS